jgi:hypothetical protein
MDVFGKYNDSVKISFVTFEKAQTGNLALKITTDTVKQYFYELRLPSGDLFAKGKLKKGLTELKFEGLRPWRLHSPRD